MDLCPGGGAATHVLWGVAPGDQPVLRERLYRGRRLVVAAETGSHNLKEGA